jgi:simple sugar transport system permease protein
MSGFALTRLSSPLAITAAVAFAMYLSAGLTEPDFFSLRMLCGLFSNQAVLGIVALGMTFVILNGGIDLSVGAVAACASIGTAVLVTGCGWHPLAASFIIVAAAASYGALMGGLIHGFRMPAFIVTLGGMFIARGVAFSISRESVAVDHPCVEAVQALPANLAATFGMSEAAAQQVAFHLPTPSILLMVMLFAAIVVLRTTRFGRSVYAIGGSEHAARLMGINVGRTRILAYALSGGCAGLAGIVHMSSLFAGDPSAGYMLELDAIAAVVIGGTVLTGGVGSAAGTILGILIFGIVETWITMREGINSAWMRIFVGGLLLCFMLIQQALLRRK